MTGPGVLVVGAGQAAVQFASTLREAGYTEPITLVGRDPHAPYQRPPLSKGFLKDGPDVTSLELRATEYYEERGIRLVLGDPVVSVERRASGSGSATLASGERLAFKRLVLATGSAVRHLTVPGSGAAGVQTMGGLDDAVHVRAGLEGARDVVVVGGGFIGLEVAATARALGRSVVVVEAGPQILGRAVGGTTAAHVQSLHEGSGIDFRLGAAPTALLARSDRVRGVSLSDGTVVDAQFVFVGVGARARTELAEELGLECEAGVVVDEHCIASDGATLAIGDCALVPDPTPSGVRGMLRLESVDSAVEQAKTAAATIMGNPAPYRGIPWFWSDQGEVKLQIAGLRAPDDTEVIRRAADPSRLVVACYRDDALVAVEAVNSPADFMILKRLLNAGGTLEPHVFSDAATSLKQAVAQHGTRAN